MRRHTQFELSVHAWTCYDRCSGYGAGEFDFCGVFYQNLKRIEKDKSEDCVICSDN